MTGRHRAPAPVRAAPSIAHTMPDAPKATPDPHSIIAASPIRPPAKPTPTDRLRPVAAATIIRAKLTTRCDTCRCVNMAVKTCHHLVSGHGCTASIPAKGDHTVTATHSAAITPAKTASRRRSGRTLPIRCFPTDSWAAAVGGGRSAGDTAASRHALCPRRADRPMPGERNRRSSLASYRYRDAQRFPGRGSSGCWCRLGSFLSGGWRFRRLGRRRLGFRRLGDIRRAGGDSDRRGSDGHRRRGDGHRWRGRRDRVGMQPAVNGLPPARPPHHTHPAQHRHSQQHGCDFGGAGAQQPPHIIQAAAQQP